jgi:uncharacterized protein
MVSRPPIRPIEDPKRPRDLLSIIKRIGSDRIMFSTDYPQRDQDDPSYAFNVAWPEPWKRMIVRNNAPALHGLDRP